MNNVVSRITMEWKKDQLEISENTCYTNIDNVKNGNNVTGVRTSNRKRMTCTSRNEDSFTGVVNKGSMTSH
jgi:hypothetical protein